MSSQYVSEINADQFDQEVLASPVPVVADFYSTECAPCEAVAPKFEGLAELFAGKVRFYKLFRQGNRELSEKLGVKSSPTLLFYKGGQEVSKRLMGGIRRSEILEASDSSSPRRTSRVRWRLNGPSGQRSTSSSSVAVPRGSPPASTPRKPSSR